MSGPGKPPNYKKFQVITLRAYWCEPEDPPYIFSAWAAWNEQYQAWVGWKDQSWIQKVPAITWLASLFVKIDGTCEHGVTREVDQHGTPTCDRCDVREWGNDGIKKLAARECEISGQ